jgi:hypothetical protein
MGIACPDQWVESGRRAAKLSYKTGQYFSIVTQGNLTDRQQGRQAMILA